MTVFVVTWRYADGSGSGFVRAFLERDQAELVMTILREHGDTMKTFALDEAPCE